jgi:IS30 family transposase
LVHDAVIDLLQPVAVRSHTISGYNAKEFAEHARIVKELDIDFFFAHPYAAWERGANENMNGWSGNTFLRIVILHWSPTKN